MRISSRLNNKIKFNTEHTNYINSDGKYVPSVTSILKILSKDDALLRWSNNLGWKHKSYKVELENSSIIGTTAHSFCEYVFTNDKELLFQIDNRLKSFNNEMYNYTINAINSFKEWYKNNKEFIEVIHTELGMCCDDYGGTTDLVCRYKNKLILLDYKTSSSFYMTQFLQLSAYARMYKILYGRKIEDVAILRLDKKYGREAELLFLSDLPNADIKYYQYVFDKLVSLYKFNNVLNNDWNNYKYLINK